MSEQIPFLIGGAVIVGVIALLTSCVAGQYEGERALRESCIKAGGTVIADTYFAHHCVQQRKETP